MNAMSVWVVIPAYNEGKVVGSVVQKVRDRFPFVVVVDDCSRDDTSRVALAAGAHIVRHSINRDQGASLQTGMRYALRRGAEVVVHFDADGQHDVADIPALIAPIMHGDADVVLGSRFLSAVPKNMPLERRIFLRGAILFTQFFSGVSLSDSHNGLRAFSRMAAQQIQIRENGKAHASEIIHEIGRQGLRYTEVPVTVHYTDYSLSRGDSSLKRTFMVLKRLFWRQLFF